MALRSHDWELITELNNTTLQKITVVCLKHHGWFVASSSFDNQQVVLVKAQTNDLRVDTRHTCFKLLCSWVQRKTSSSAHMDKSYR